MCKMHAIIKRQFHRPRKFYFHETCRRKFPEIHCGALSRKFSGFGFALWFTVYRHVYFHENCVSAEDEVSLCDLRTESELLCNFHITIIVLLSCCFASFPTLPLYTVYILHCKLHNQAANYLRKPRDGPLDFLHNNWHLCMRALEAGALPLSNDDRHACWG